MCVQKTVARLAVVMGTMECTSAVTVGQHGAAVSATSRLQSTHRQSVVASSGTRLPRKSARASPVATKLAGRDM